MPGLSSYCINSERRYRRAYLFEATGTSLSFSFGDVNRFLPAKIFYVPGLYTQLYTLSLTSTIKSLCVVFNEPNMRMKYTGEVNKNMTNTLQSSSCIFV